MSNFTKMIAGGKNKSWLIEKNLIQREASSRRAFLMKEARDGDHYFDHFA